MKQILKFMIPCLTAVFALTSCYDTMDDKADIDAKYGSAFSTPTVAITSATTPTHTSIAVTASFSDSAAVAEQGVEFATDENFKNVKTIVNKENNSTFTATLEGLEELTTRYVRAYAMGRNGVLVYSEVKKITTPEAPIFALEGSYTAVEYEGDPDSGEWTLPEEAEPYTITIAFEEGSSTTVNITNIWGGGMTVQGTYDAEQNTITVPNMQNIYIHPSYGDVWLKGLAKDFSAFTDNVVFKFTPKGGAMQSTPMAAQCSLGNFGFFYLVMQHD